MKDFFVAKLALRSFRNKNYREKNMLQIILAIIVICIAFTIIKKVGGFVLKLLKCIFRLIFGLIYLAISGPAILCTKIFYDLTKLLHI